MFFKYDCIFLGQEFQVDFEYVIVSGLSYWGKEQTTYWKVLKTNFLTPFCFTCFPNTFFWEPYWCVGFYIHAKRFFGCYEIPKRFCHRTEVGQAKNWRFGDILCRNTKQKILQFARCRIQYVTCRQNLFKIGWEEQSWGSLLIRRRRTKLHSLLW